MTATQASELPLDKLRDKTTFELYSCPEFEIMGVLYGSKLFLHLDWPNPRFTPSIYRKGLTAIAQIKSAAKDRGIPAIYVFVPEMLEKWENMFGFRTVEVWQQHDPTAPKLLLMKQET